MTVVLTVEQVAERMQVSKAAVYLWIRTGELACMRRGERFTRVTEAQLAEFVGRYEVPAERRRR